MLQTTHFKLNVMKKNLSKLLLLLAIGGSSLTACSHYTAEEYLNEMRELTEETLKNASSYTDEDWKKVGERFREINAKGKDLLDQMTEEQRKELKDFSQEFSDQASEFNHQEFKEDLDNLLDKADSFIDEAIRQMKEE